MDPKQSSYKRSHKYIWINNLDTLAGAIHIMYDMFHANYELVNFPLDKQQFGKASSHFLILYLLASYHSHTGQLVWCISLTPLFGTCSYIDDLMTDRSLLAGHNALNSYDRQLGIFNMHYYIDQITHGTDFVQPVGDTDWSKLLTCRLQVSQCDQSECNRADTNRQSPEHRPS